MSAVVSVFRIQPHQRKHSLFGSKTQCVDYTSHSAFYTNDHLYLLIQL